MNAGLKRVDRLPGGVARLVDSVPDEDLTACLHLIIATVLDVTAVSTPEIREAIKDSLKNRKVSEAEGSEKVTIRSKSLREPSFSTSRNTGRRDYVLPGNEEYKVGDEIPKPQGGGGGRGVGERSASTRRRFLRRVVRRFRITFQPLVKRREQYERQESGTQDAADDDRPENDAFQEASVALFLCGGPRGCRRLNALRIFDSHDPSPKPRGTS